MPTASLRSFHVRPTQDYSSPLHWHAWDQLTYASEGVMRVRGDLDTWLIPPERAIWIPARTRHAEQLHAPAAMTTAYINTGLVRHLPRRVAMLEVTPLLRELLAHVGTIGELHRRVASHARLLGVLIDQLAAVPHTLQLPMPRAGRSREVAELLRSQPGAKASVDALGRHVGASRRTLERVFLAETKMTIGAWRRQLRLQHAVRLLASGAAVGRVAREAGYSSTSAFIAVFKKTFGTTPLKFREAR